MFAGHGALVNDNAVFCCHDYTKETFFTTSVELKSIRSMAEKLGFLHQVFHMARSGK
jgi:hypothetical protein